MPQIWLYLTTVYVCYKCFYCTLYCIDWQLTAVIQQWSAGIISQTVRRSLSPWRRLRLSSFHSPVHPFPISISALSTVPGVPTCTVKSSWVFRGAQYVFIKGICIVQLIRMTSHCVCLCMGETVRVSVCSVTTYRPAAFQTVSSPGHAAGRPELCWKWNPTHKYSTSSVKNSTQVNLLTHMYYI